MSLSYNVRVRGLRSILTEIKNANLKGLISSVYADLLEFIFTNSSSISIFETKELTFVNDCFKYERNEEIGHYRQTLTNFSFLFSSAPLAAFFEASCRRVGN